MVAFNKIFSYAFLVLFVFGLTSIVFAGSCVKYEGDITQYTESTAHKENWATGYGIEANSALKNGINNAMWNINKQKIELGEDSCVVVSGNYYKYTDDFGGVYVIYVYDGWGNNDFWVWTVSRPLYSTSSSSDNTSDKSEPTTPARSQNATQQSPAPQAQAKTTPTSSSTPTSDSLLNPKNYSLCSFVAEKTDFTCPTNFGIVDNTREFTLNKELDTAKKATDNGLAYYVTKSSNKINIITAKTGTSVCNGVTYESNKSLFYKFQYRDKCEERYLIFNDAGTKFKICWPTTTECVAKRNGATDPPAGPDCKCETTPCDCSKVNANSGDTDSTNDSPASTLGAAKDGTVTVKCTNVWCWVLGIMYRDLGGTKLKLEAGTATST